MMLSEKIMTLRKKKGWSQEELAEKLDISRQSVSKWESASSVPDIDKIIQLSHIFGVSTDWLLKDEEETEVVLREEEYEETDVKVVSMEEAGRFIELERKLAIPRALATALCVLSPVPLILLSGISELGNMAITEDMAGGTGVAVLLILLAVGVAVLVFSENRLEKYEYIEKEIITLQYGVKGMASKKKEEFSGIYNLCITSGTVLCILGVVPLMMMAAFSAADIVYIYGVCILLAMVSVAVLMFVWAGCIRGSYDKLLQEGDYTAEKKTVERKTSFFPGAYWCLVVAIFLAWGFHGDSWKTAGMVWPVAALIFVVIQCILKAIVGARQGKS
ncbi:MAG TPA: XRE family transcriptional regulator [Lachnospiraceae bacterium]|nr:XRE family transcriptional regulator [Lachnospiraceae bacterium]